MDAISDRPRRAAGRAHRILLVVGAFIIVALAALILVPIIIPTEGLRKSAEASVSDLLDRPVRIENLRLRVLPTPKVLLRRVEVDSSASGKADSLARIERLRVRFALLPLLRGRVEVVGVDIDEGFFRLERLSDGSFREADLLDAPGRLDRERTRDFALSLSRVAVDLVDHHVEPSRPVLISARNTRGRLIVEEGGEQAAVEMESALFGHSERNLEVRGLLPLSTRPVGDEREAAPAHRPSSPIDLRVRVEGLQTAPLIPYLGRAVAHLPAGWAASLSVEGDLATGVEVEGIFEPAKDLVFSFAGRVDASQRPWQLEIAVSEESIDLNHLVMSLPVIVSALPNPVYMDGEADLLCRLSGTTRALRLTGWIHSSNMRLLAGSMLNGEDQSGLSLDSENAIADFDLEIGEERPRLSLDLRSTRVVLDYRSGSEPTDVPEPDPPAALVTARLRIETGRLRALVFEDLDAHSRYENGLMTIRPWLRTGEGSVRARIDTDLRRSPSSHRMELELISIDVEALAKALLVGRDPPVTGVLDLETLLTWRGVDFETFRDSAQGRGSFILSRGRIAALDLEPDVGEAIRQVSETLGLTPPQEFAQPTLKEARSSFVVADGIVSTEVMEVRGEDVRILLGGGLSMDRQLAVSGSFAFSPTATRGFGPLGRLLRGPDGWLSVPFSVSGPIDSPAVSIDVAALLMRAGEGVIGSPDNRWEELRRLLRDSGLPAGL